MNQKYGAAVVVFDGYDENLSVKTCTHQRRGYSDQLPSLIITPDNVYEGKMYDFLCNP